MKKFFFLIFLFGISLGFIIGLVKSGVIIYENNYLSYKMFRIAYLLLRDQINHNIIYSLFFTFISSFFVWLFLKFRVFHFFLKNKNKKRERELKKISQYLFGKRVNYKILGINGILLFIMGLINIIPIILKPAGLKEKPNILFILIDTLRYDHLGAYGYKRNTSPFIDKLAKKSVLFKNAFNNASWTKPSIASIFTSFPPNVHGVVSFSYPLSKKFLTLAEVYKNAGYHTSFFNGGNPNLIPKFNFDQGFDHYYETEWIKGKKTKFFPGGDGNLVLKKFKLMMNKIKKKRFFSYLHFQDCHTPFSKNEFNYIFLEQGEKKNSNFIPGDILSNVNTHLVKENTMDKRLSEEDKEYLIKLYDAQIYFIDRKIKEIIELFEKNKILKNTIIIISSDHGEEFWEHGFFSHGHTLYNEILRVPLIIYSPTFFKASEIKFKVQLNDLFLTLLNLSGIKSEDYKLNGMDIFDPSYEEKRSKKPFFFSGTAYFAEKFSLIYNDKKLIWNTREKLGKNLGVIHLESPYKFEIYDLNLDPNEKKNLWKKEDRYEYKNLFKLLYEFITHKILYKEKEKKLDFETREKLRSLGYMQ